MQLKAVRIRFFVAVEGESEQSFITWLQRLSDPHLPIHLNSFLLGGGGYKTMLENAVREHKRQRKISRAFRKRFFIVDADRASHGDWPIEQLRQAPAGEDFTLCVQHPNHEGLLLRMLPGMERENTDANSATTKLKNRWRAYDKPMNAHALAGQFTLADLRRMAGHDADFKTFLEEIGLMQSNS